MRATLGVIDTSEKDFHSAVMTKKRYVRFQPNPKKYSSNAAKQKAYRDRKKANVTTKAKSVTTKKKKSELEVLKVRTKRAIDLV